MITDTPLDAGALIAASGLDESGATAAFVGTARNSSSSKPGTEVIRLEYEAYEPMACAEMETIAREAVERYSVLSVRLHHRIGVLPIGEAAVVVVVAAPHRAAAFDSCRFVIEELKKRVPIWKKEVFNDGSEWVNARP
ncbi:MAG: molybdenum cofactor biosynthesis protein MoaE [Bacteroidetes bacterium]|nr:molybdenum cofactor biosynthesis protein MoaE [Bacteroidota bacterium]